MGNLKNNDNLKNCFHRKVLIIYNIIHSVSKLLSVYFAVQVIVYWANKRIKDIKDGTINERRFYGFGWFGLIFFIASSLNISMLILLALDKDKW